MTTPTPEEQRGFGRATLARPADGTGDEPLTFVASSQVVNRYGYSLRTDGWRLENYNANPVVLWMHNPFQPPIGAGRAIAKDGQVLLDAVTFDRDDALARLVEGKYRRGFLNAVSVGFDFVDEDGAPMDAWWRLSAEEIRDEAFYELAEVSAVSVPADPLALKQNARLALGRLGTELTALLDEHERSASSAAAPAAVPAAQLEAAVRAEMARLGLPPNPSPAPAGARPITTPTAVEIDDDAARRVLAAFDLGGRSA